MCSNVSFARSKCTMLCDMLAWGMKIIAKKCSNRTSNVIRHASKSECVGEEAGGGFFKFVLGLC